LLIVCAQHAGRVRLRNQLVENVLRGRIPQRLRDDIARERQMGDRVVDHTIELREVAAAHLQRRHGRQIGLALADPVALVIEEVERLVFDDRAAHCAAELMLAEIGLRPSGAVVEEVVGVERVVAEEFEDAAVRLVGARLDLQVDDAAERMAELR
jgi:hypothetical protein